MTEQQTTPTAEPWGEDSAGEYFVVRDRELRARLLAEQGRNRPGVIVQPIMQFKYDGEQSSGGNCYYEHDHEVSDWSLPDRRKSMEINHVAELCICLHSKLTHSAAVTRDTCGGKRPDGSPCKCERFNPVSPRGSQHAYRRGMKVKRRKLADIGPGDRVTAGWTTYAGRVRLNCQRTGALVVTITGRKAKLSDEQAGDQSWRNRMWIMQTDLGDSLPQAGNDDVLVIVD